MPECTPFGPFSLKKQINTHCLCVSSRSKRRKYFVEIKCLDSFWSGLTYRLWSRKSANGTAISDDSIIKNVYILIRRGAYYGTQLNGLSSSNLMGMQLNGPEGACDIRPDKSAENKNAIFEFVVWDRLKSRKLVFVVFDELIQFICFKSIPSAY